MRGINSKNKLKGISKSCSRNIKLEEYYNCLFGGEYQKNCDNYLIWSINHEMYILKSPLSLFDDKRCYIKVNIGIIQICYLINRC